MLFVQHVIIDAEDLAKKNYFKLIQEYEKSSERFTKFMNAAIDAKNVKLNFSLTNPSSGHGILTQIKRHYDLSFML
jgi:hypothetical protein